ncbi:MAG: class I SAM-dependent methyltransferase [Nitrospirota bacterium]
MRGRRVWTGVIRTFDQFRDAISSFRLPRVLITALELNLFAAVGDRAWTVPALARRLKVNERGLDILCRNLASAGLLVKRGDRYRNGTLARTELNSRHPDFRGAYLELIRSHWDEWSQLTTSVRTGRPVEHEDPDEPAYRRRFSWAMHQRSIRAAAEVAAQVKLDGAGTLLDLGGGPGTYALAFLARNPRLRATVCDRAPALEVAREIAATHRHGRRLAYLPLDFMKQAVPGRYDVIWYSNVLHIYSPEENRRLFRRLASALNPGGRLLIQDIFLLDREGLYPAEANLFAATMLLFTEGGNTYGLRETATWLRETGFAQVRPIKLKEGTGDWEGDLLEARLTRRQQDRRSGTRARRTGSGAR